MNGWLLDTNVISAFAPGKPARSRTVTQWFESRSARLFLSTVTAAEIGVGVAKLHGAGAQARAAAIAEWFERLLTLYGDRLLPFDLPAARLFGEITHEAARRGHTAGFADAAIAAIARAQSLTVLTSNLRHFTPLGVETLDPFDESLP